MNSWLNPNIDRANYSDLFSEKWHELKFLLEIDTDEFDEQILTYIDPPPLNDMFLFSNQNCDMVGSCLQRIEQEILKGLKHILEGFNYYINNYEKEIIKEQVNKLN